MKCFRNYESIKVMKMRRFNVYYAHKSNINSVLTTQYCSDSFKTLIIVLNEYFEKNTDYILLRVEEVTS